MWRSGNSRRIFGPRHSATWVLAPSVVLAIVSIEETKVPGADHLHRERTHAQLNCDRFRHVFRTTNAAGTMSSAQHASRGLYQIPWLIPKLGCAKARRIPRLRFGFLEAVSKPHGAPNSSLTLRVSRSSFKTAQTSLTLRVVVKFPDALSSAVSVTSGRVTTAPQRGGECSRGEQVAEPACAVLLPRRAVFLILCRNVRCRYGTVSTTRSR
jgi:hypothetical protein